MKRIWILLIALLSFSPAVWAEFYSDVYVGWHGVQQNFKTNTNLSVAQKGIGLGARFYIPANEQLFLGGEVGFSHIETNWDISGNITHLQFLIKFLPSEMIDLFAGMGIAGRGAPSDIGGSNNDWALFGGMADAGVALVFGEEKWRVELALYYFSFTGRIFNAIDEDITSYGVGLHVGKTFNLD